MADYSNAPAWEQKLRAMVKYYVTCEQEGDINKFLSHYPVTNPNEKIDPEARDKLKQFGGESIDDHKEAAGEMHALTEELKNDPNPDRPAWEERIIRKREELIRRSAEIIEQKTNEVIAHIHTIPDQQRDGAASFWEDITAGFIQFWAEAWDWIVSAVKAIIDWILNMWETIKTAFKQVGKVFAKAMEWLEVLL